MQSDDASQDGKDDLGDLIKFLGHVTPQVRHSVISLDLTGAFEFPRH
jgi:hypothetical protein